MKYLDKFESFKITEGIFVLPKLSNIKSKVKQFLSKDKKEGEMMEEEEEEELKKSYKFRSPTRVSREKWRSKLSYKKVPFTKKERDLFQKLKKNPNHIIWGYFVMLGLFYFNKFAYLCKARQSRGSLSGSYPEGRWFESNLRH